MNMDHSWNDGRGKLKYLEKSWFLCHFIHHKSHIDWHRIEPGPLLILYKLRTDSKGDVVHTRHTAAKRYLCMHF
jgi:hypothetical protein